VNPQAHSATDRLADRADSANAGVPALRRAAMALLAESTAQEIAVGLRVFDAPLAHTELRRPETGLVMLRGRIGGDGAAFNLGEATVTRCAVQLASGEVGFSYLLGRDADKARLAALCDALLQSPAHSDLLELHLLAPIRARVEKERAQTAARTAATRVDFFALARGED
jgi:alpha-D-ribose 1-methylphosphonate 5-triphosphate synthase subunit PhnG